MTFLIREHDIRCKVCKGRNAPGENAIPLRLCAVARTSSYPIHRGTKKLLFYAVPKTTYQVYVVELSKKVFTENARFRAANPQFNGVLECLYVGMTSKTPLERFKQHKSGYVNKKGHKLSAYIVQRYGSYLRPSLYNDINENPMSREEALRMEEKLAWDLRNRGYAVWFN